MYHLANNNLFQHFRIPDHCCKIQRKLHSPVYVAAREAYRQCYIQVALGQLREHMTGMTRQYHTLSYSYTQEDIARC